MRLILKISLALASLTLFTACKNGGAEFRRVLRSAARETAKTSNTDDKKNGKKISTANGIKSCPEGAKLLGAAGQAQWCSLPTKDGKGAKHGEYRKWHDGGNTKIACFYDHGKLQGKYTEWHTNGQKKVSGGYLDNDKTGRWTEWSAEGTKLYEKSFLNGVPHGRSTVWSKKGNMESEGNYYKGEKSGIWIAYNAQGEPKSKISFKAGKKNGQSEIYSRDGQIKQVESYFADIPHGTWITFWPNGSKKLEGNFVKGQKAGPWVTYAKDGSLKQTNVFKDGTSTKIAANGSSGENTKQKKRRSKRNRFGKGDILGAEPPIANNTQVPPQTEVQKPSKLSTGQNWQSF